MLSLNSSLAHNWLKSDNPACRAFGIGRVRVKENDPGHIRVTATRTRAITPESARQYQIQPPAVPQSYTLDIDVSQEEKYELKVKGDRFAVAEGQGADVAGASLGIFFRLLTGAMVQGYTVAVADEDKSRYTVQSAGGMMLKESSTDIHKFYRPQKPIILYEFDSCPYCKKAVTKGGKSRFPYMHDPNTGIAMYESDEIIQYLADTYGDGSVPFALQLGLATDVTASLSGIGRVGHGGRYSPSLLPLEPLVFWAFEASPFCRIVRERLVELEIPHIFKSAARGSPKRDEMFEKYGQFQVPLLEDPNTKIALFESTEIIKYLNETYAKAA